MSGKDSWKEKVPTIVKQGALRFLVCPNSINQSVRGVRVGNLKCSAPWTSAGVYIVNDLCN